MQVRKQKYTPKPQQKPQKTKTHHNLLHTKTENTTTSLQPPQKNPTKNKPQKPYSKALYKTYFGRSSII